MATISQIKIGDNVYRLKDAPLTHEMSNTWMLQKVIGMHNRSAVTISSPSYGSGKWEQLCGCKFSIERTINNSLSGALSNYILPDMYVLGVGSVLWNDSNNYTGIKRVVRINFDKDVDLNELIWDDGSSSLYQDWTSGHGYSAPLTTNTGTTTTHQNISACCYINSTNYNYISEEQSNEKILHPRLLACQDTGHNIDVDGTCSLLVFTLGGDHLFLTADETDMFVDYFWITFDENTIGQEDYNWND